MEKPITITDRAAEEIKLIFEQKNIPQDYKLRITVRGGRGCMAVALTLGFDKEQADDLSMEIQSIPVVIHKRELMYIIGKQLDFYDGSDARGFHFEGA
ncbi:MAG: iron-sulfur cluster biosynthesis family protein [Bacteroidota bacterium]